MLSQKQQNNSPAPVKNDRFWVKDKKLIAQIATVGFVVLVMSVLLFAMTTAWFTNVVQTQDMMFQAEVWGFEGSVTLSETSVPAMPGDSGVIGMTVTNNSAEASALTVSVSKAYMQEQELQQRIYFYADETATVNGEQVQRQYLSNVGGYSYTISGMNQLIISDTTCTDIPLRWQWVYDMVGYYYTGMEANGQITATEYLRPVEYDYFEAQYDENGNLTMVDAETSAAEFLQKLTETDGYPGAFQAQKSGNDMILVDENGEAVQKEMGSYCIRPATETQPGVWLYLCSLEEIEANTRWDTSFVNRELETDRSFSARITLTGVQLQQQITGVSNPATLATALENGDKAVVQLQSNMTLTEGIALAQNTNVTLDLNGHVLEYIGSDPAFLVNSGSKLTVCNGTFTGNENNIAFRSVGGQVTLSDVEVTDVFVALRIEDDKTQNAHGDNSVIRIVDCNLQSYDDTVQICGDGATSAGKTVLIVENSVLGSQTYVAILGKGNSTQWGTDIQIINSTVIGYYAGIYHPMQRSSLTISNGSIISGMTGVVMKGGDLTVIDSTISGTGTSDIVDVNENPTLSGSGWLDTGDGIYIETDYNHPISVTVSGDSKITCAAVTAEAVRVYPAAEHVVVRLTGGIYSTNVSAFVADGYSCEATEEGYRVKQ